MNLDLIRDSDFAWQTPCYVYDLDGIQATAQRLRAAFGSHIQLSYAVKSNPNTRLLQQMRDIVDYLDVSSGGELAKAIDQCGWSSSKLTFTGPGKTTAELELAVSHKIRSVIIESLDEAESLNKVCGSRQTQQSVLVRIGPRELPPGFGVRMAGRPTQFGIDEEQLNAVIPKLLELENLMLDGFHIYAGTQSLSAEALHKNYRNMLQVFQTQCEQFQIRPRELILGSGLGIPYHQDEGELDLPGAAEGMHDLLGQLKQSAAFGRCEFLLELGRYLVGDQGCFLTRVIRVKESRGTLIAICDGGMNHNNGACGHLGSVIHRNYRISRLRPPNTSEPTKSYNLVGPLCTSIDTLGHDVELPELSAGDILIVESGGAYGLTASPMRFISHPPAKEYLRDGTSGSDAILDVSEHS